MGEVVRGLGIGILGEGGIFCVFCVSARCAGRDGRRKKKGRRTRSFVWKSKIFLYAQKIPTFQKRPSLQGNEVDVSNCSDEIRQMILHHCRYPHPCTPQPGSKYPQAWHGRCGPWWSKDSYQPGLPAHRVANVVPTSRRMQAQR